MTQIQSRDAAVSPVIGVMLMLVVTIIIAAVVSAFAGGLTGSTTKAPQLALGGKLVYDADHEKGSLTLIHKGGDALIWQNIDIRIFMPNGKYMDKVWTVECEDDSTSTAPYECSYIPGKADDMPSLAAPIPIRDVVGGITTWAPALKNGEEATFQWGVVFAPIDAAEGWVLQPTPPLDPTIPARGDPVDIQIFDKLSGKMIISLRVTVT